MEGPPTPLDGCNLLGLHTVSNLIDPSLGTWNSTLLHSTFSNETCWQIESIRPRSGLPDIRRWALTKNGDFSVKSLHHKLNLHSFPLTVHHRNNIWHKIWSLKTIPRIQMFVWKLYNLILPVKDYINRILHTNDPLCPFCDMHNETVHHLFIDCPFSRAVWFHFHQATHLHLHHDLSVEEWISSWFLGNNGQEQEIGWAVKCATICWHIWKVRCKVVFEHVNPSPRDVACSIMPYLFSIQPSSPIHALQTTNDQTTDNVSYWTAPSFHVIKLNYSASYSQSVNNVGLGFILRDHAGRVLGARSLSVAASSAEESDGLALLTAVQWAVTLQLRNVVFEGDARVITRYLTSNQGTVGWRTKNLLDETKILAESLDSTVYVYIKKNVNKVASILAKKARIMLVDDTWNHQPPSFLFESLNADIQSVIMDVP
ncbi:Reverse transcriptase zinc-binding domain [Macleaya cordata]|uniref:Reverse transcriptase zinc-binding domain n=1 Tax=Macleaya cordata TaxID=56857 RepID=A0A200QKN0_MACCD|nr:Reverse transcriptase zinc-binding domain [Macleaya cordata]